MEDDLDLTCLLGVLTTLGAVSRKMHPGRLAPLIETLGDQDVRLTVAAAGSEGQVALAANLALQACAGLRAAPQADNPMMQAYRAMRQYSRSLEALAALAETVPAVGRYLLEPQFRDDPAWPNRHIPTPEPPISTTRPISVADFPSTSRRGTIHPSPRRWLWRCTAVPVTGVCSCGTGCRRRGRGASSSSGPLRSAAPGL